jgi:hypothetical protein
MVLFIYINGSRAHYFYKVVLSSSEPSEWFLLYTAVTCIKMDVEDNEVADRGRGNKRQAQNGFMYKRVAMVR